ncbi:MAG: hypothetical protein JO271_02285 [Verrucomicrobia bacterium]|nr:hypothetical protein [Verrucomicrobiota bacterium]
MKLSPLINEISIEGQSQGASGVKEKAVRGVQGVQGVAGFQEGALDFSLAEE